MPYQESALTAGEEPVFGCLGLMLNFTLRQWKAPICHMCRLIHMQSLELALNLVLLVTFGDGEKHLYSALSVKLNKR